MAGRWVESDVERCLQEAERQPPVHRPENLSSAATRQSRLAAHVEVNESRHRIEGLILQTVLDPGVGLTGLNHRLSDEEVKGLLLPVAGEDKVALMRLRVSDEEVAVVHHQALGNLGRHFFFFIMTQNSSKASDSSALASNLVSGIIGRVENNFIDK